MEGLHFLARTLELDMMDLLLIRELKLTGYQVCALEFDHRMFDALPHLAYLERLDLESNNLCEFPDHFGGLDQLIHLNLDNNHFGKIPNTFCWMSSLAHLSMRWNHLTQLPINLTRLNNLKTLDLLGNPITRRLPKRLGQMTSLRSLILGHARALIQLPDSIGRLTNLRNLVIEYGGLARLPDSIGFLTNLEGLILPGNKLTNLPDSTGRLTNLTSLRLEGNKLTSLPISIDYLAKLKYDLQLSHNRITALPACIAGWPPGHVYVKTMGNPCAKRHTANGVITTIEADQDITIDEDVDPAQLRVPTLLNLCLSRVHGMTMRANTYQAPPVRFDARFVEGSGIPKTWTSRALFLFCMLVPTGGTTFALWLTTIFILNVLDMTRYWLCRRLDMATRKLSADLMSTLSLTIQANFMLQFFVIGILFTDPSSLLTAGLKLGVALVVLVLVALRA